MKTWSVVLAMMVAVVVAARAEEAAAPAGEEVKITGDAAKGAETYKLYCVACHGELGKGDGIAAAALNPKPRDFTDKERMSKISDKEILTVIKDGGAAVGLSPMMTAWGALLQSDEKIQDVAAYVRTFAK